MAKGDTTFEITIVRNTTMTDKEERDDKLYRMIEAMVGEYSEDYDVYYNNYTEQ